MASFPPYTPIVGTLGYIMSPDKQQTLLIHRNARKNDDHLGKYNGLGGKLHPNESVVDGMKREILEEANITCKELTLRGTINWTGFGAKKENWLGFIFRIDAFEGTPNKTNEEGSLEWISLNQLDTVPMWKGDRYFLPLVFDADPKIFHGYMPYDKEYPINWSFSRI